MAIISDQMGGQLPPETQPPAGQPGPGQPPVDPLAADQQPGTIPPGEEDDLEDDEVEADVDHPAYQAALRFVADALYRDNGAAESIAVQLSKGMNKNEALANVAYEIMTVAVEKLEGNLPEELYLVFAATILEELNDIAEAADVTYAPEDLADVLKRLILRYLGELGVDTTELEQAMNQVTPETFSKLAEQGGDIPDDR